MREVRPPSTSVLFDWAVHPGREEALADLGVEVVARPGMAAPTKTAPGTFMVRRALGEGRLAVLSAVERLVEGRALLEAAGVACEGAGDGVFVEVDDGPGGRRAFRIAGPEGVVARDTVLLQPRRVLRSRPLREIAEDRQPEPIEGREGDPVEDAEPLLPMLLAAVYALRRRGRRKLREEYLRSLLEPPTGRPALGDDLQRAVADLEQGLRALEEPTPAAARSLFDELARGLLAAAERLFILDPQRSTLELLEPAERDRYVAFTWEPGDFPGGPTGPNEARAEQMFAALTRLRPERRANQGATAAVRADEFDAMQARLGAAMVFVPGEKGLQLHADASASWVQMRSAARAEGVTLVIGLSYRPAARAQAHTARADNRPAVASFSSHTLGLAVDLLMSHSGLRFGETSPKPFQNLVDMYKSPVHKWMFLRGETHGWFPYRREPWHWEYNPPGFRERLRSQPSDVQAPAADREAEAITDPIAPPRAPLAITGSVGRGGRNLAADVRAVQDRLVELRALEPTDAATERPASPTAVDSVLPRTIDAIDTFQRHMGIPVDGQVAIKSATRTDLDRAIPPPTASELTVVDAERSAVRQSVSRGLTLTGAVGAVSGGNAPADVRAVQQRLVEIGRLSASHRESPAAGATGAVPQSGLSTTIAALRTFQTDVRFWISRKTITGAIVPGVAAPGDATAALLDRVSVYSMGVGSTQITFHDHVASGATRSEAGVMFVGTSPPSVIPIAEYRALGLTAAQAAALKLVSTFEGNFDAINTYDRALVSAGFIQFAGSRGLPRYLALLKARQPAKFRDLLQKVGIDVEFSVAGGAVESPRVVVLDPAGSSVLRATAAEAAIRDDKRLTAALILSGRDHDVQLAQIEAAVRDYVLPALGATVSWAARTSARLGDLLQSQKGMAALFDRSIQEGLGAARRRFERVIQGLVRGGGRGADGVVPAPLLAQLQRREGDVLAELERDLQAGADVAATIARARAALETLIEATTGAAASLASVLARPELADARRAVTDARTGLSAIVNVAPSPNVTVDATLGAMNTTLTSEESRLALTPSPASLAALAAILSASRQALATVGGPLSTSPTFLARVQRIRRSPLDSGLTEVA